MTEHVKYHPPPNYEVLFMPGDAKLRKVSAKIKTPFFEIAGDWEADESD